MNNFIILGKNYNKRNQFKDMNIKLDKYYTPKEVAKKCIDLTIKEVSKRIDITEIIEPSAGSGSFSDQIKNCIAYDIEPEKDYIEKKDFLKIDIGYKKGRLIIGNPPFGKRNNLARSFYKKSVKISDAIGFILPISQLNNKDSLYEFDLIKSIDLGEIKYNGNTKIKSCFNIYIRPKSGKLNNKPKLKIDWFNIYRDDEKNYNNIEEDLCIFRRGSSIGKEKFINKDKQTYKIIVKDKSKINYLKEKILNYNWKEYKKHQSAPSISKNDIYRLFL